MVPIDWIVTTGFRGPCGRSPARRGGFTLIELMTVLTIIAILATLAVPRFSASIQRQRLDAAANRIVADLRLARQHARVANVSQTVQFYPAQLQYELVGMASPNHPDEAYITDLSVTPYEIAALSANCGGDALITFDIYGVPDSGGTISVLVGDGMRIITIDGETGEPSVAE